MQMAWASASASMASSTPMFHSWCSSFLVTPWAKVGDRKSTRLNSSHTVISYAVFCLKKKKKWIPGNHRPTGPVDHITGVVFTATGKVLPRRTDDEDRNQ